MVGYPYTYGDTLSQEEATQNLAKFGRFVAPALIAVVSNLCFKQVVNALDPPKGVADGAGQGLPPADGLPQPGPGIPGHLEGRPPAPSAPMFDPYIPPAQAAVCNPFFVALGAISVIGTCSAAFITNDKRLYIACLGWLAYIGGTSGAGK